MIRIILSFAILSTFISPSIQAQQLTQTVRGTILDADSHLPLVGAQVIIKGSNPLKGAVSNQDGQFRLTGVPSGRIRLQVSYIGYESQILPSIVVHSGKEVILRVMLQESVQTMKDVTVTPNTKKGDALNMMAMVSARLLSPDETQRFANSYDDPALILSNFAGVTKTHNGSNDVIVRGNSPKYVQWRLEGAPISNPNHFAAQNSVGLGGLSALNNNLLTSSDFYTGAFAPEYGNVLSGVYDIKLRSGNNEQFESSFGFGLLGTDFTMEGPFAQNYGGSYLLNYRYSTIAMINELGLTDLDGVPKFQDLNYKVVLPTEKWGRFSIFGLGGYSNFAVSDVDPTIWDTPGDRGLDTHIKEDFEKDSYLFNTGVNHTMPLNDTGYLHSSLSLSHEGITDEVIESTLDQQQSGSVVVIDQKPNFNSEIHKTTYRGSVTYHHKLSAQDQFEVGSTFSLHHMRYRQKQWKEDDTAYFTLTDFNEIMGLLRNYVSWKHRFNKHLSVVGGFHNMNLFLNDQHTLEPRVAFRWSINERNSLQFGYGNHSTLPSLHNYFTRVEQEDGKVIQPNLDLSLLKAHHFVLGYEKRIADHMLAKVELYYQDLYHLPVEHSKTSSYATLNEGLEFRYVDLVNRGTGKNAGVEFTLERFFANHYFFLLNGSLYDSKYTAMDGVERNTQFNGRYQFNVLAGKEYTGLGQRDSQTLSLNLKVFYAGGRPILSLMRNEHGDLAVDPVNNQYWDYEHAYNQKLDDLYSIILTVSYTFNRQNATHELFLNLDNLTDTKGRITEFYDEQAPQNIGYVRQFGFFPNLKYKVYF